MVLRFQAQAVILKGFFYRFPLVGEKFLSLAALQDIEVYSPPDGNCVRILHTLCLVLRFNGLHPLLPGLGQHLLRLAPVHPVSFVAVDHQGGGGPGGRADSRRADQPQRDAHRQDDRQDQPLSSVSDLPASHFQLLFRTWGGAQLSANSMLICMYFSS